MKFLKNFQLFESKRKKLSEYDDLMGRLLHLYGSIPLEKEKASVVISKIIFNTIGKYYRLGEDVNITHQADHDKVRFKDYFDSLLKSKDSRGHNFEGTLAGLYDGELSERGEKWDIIIDDKSWSVKFIDNPSKAPEIGSFNKAILDASKEPDKKDTLSIYYPNLDNDIIEAGGLTKLFRSNDNNELKEKAFNVVSSGITGGWIIAYPIKSKESNNINIQLNIITVDEMREMLVDKGMSVAPKAGIKSKFTLAISAKFKYNKDITKSLIKIPILPLNQLRRIARSDNEIGWAKEVFGKYGYKIRPDVLRFIKNNSGDIANRLIKFKNFNDETP